MKISKINKEFLNLYYKKKLIAYELDYDNGKVYLTDIYRLYIINMEDMALNFQLFKPVSLKQLIDDTGYVDGIITNTIYNYKDNYRLITGLIGKDNLLHIKVNDKFLDLFDNPEVKIKDNKSPVLVYENNEIVGLVIPVKEY